MSAKEAQRKAYKERKAREAGAKTQTASQLLSKKAPEKKTNPNYKGDANGIWDRSRGGGAPEGAAYEIKPITRIHRVPDALIGPDCPEGIADSHRVAVMPYLPDMG